MKKVPRDTAIFHQEFHPNGLTNAEVKLCYYKHCNFISIPLVEETEKDRIANKYAASDLYISGLLIARSRPFNLKDKIYPSMLHMVPSKTVAQYIHKTCRYTIDNNSNNQMDDNG